jgi:hypothetical protein
MPLNLYINKIGDYMKQVERRNLNAYKLRVYVGAIKTAKAMTDAEWVTEWARHVTTDSKWITRLSWIAYLEACALSEAEAMIDYKEAA